MRHLTAIIFILAFLMPIVGFTQTPKKTQSELRQEMLAKKKETVAYASEKPEFKINQAPDKWKNESAVILAEEYKYEYDFKSHKDGNMNQISNLIFKEKVRKRILIQDKMALEHFSQFYFYGNTDEKFIHIIKPDGRVISVDMKAAVKVESDIPGYYTSYAMAKHKYEKLAVAELEVGDIIDYSFSDMADYEYMASTHTYLDYPAIVVPLKSKYPMMYQNIEFHMERTNFLTTRSLNGAPSIQQRPESDRKYSDYFIESRDVERKNAEPWDYQLLEDPIIKFQVVYCMLAKRKEIPMFFPPEKIGELKKDITLDEIKLKINECLNSMSLRYSAIAVQDAEAIINLMKRTHPDVVDQQTYLKYAYYMYRNMKLNPLKMYGSFNPYMAIYDAQGMSPYLSMYGQGTINEFEFLEMVKAICKRKKWDCRVGIGIPRELGKIENIISMYDLEFFPVVDGIAIFKGTSYSLYSGSKEYLDGTKAYLIKNNRNAKVIEFDDYEINKTTFTDNVAEDIYTVNLDLTNLMTTVRDSSVTGGYCNELNREVIFSNEDIWANENEITGERKAAEKTSKNKSASGGNKKREEERKRIEDEAKETKRKEKLDKLKSLIEEDGLVVDKMLDFTLCKDGRSELNPNRIYTTSYVLKDLLSRVGSNYLLNVGKIIGEQYIVKEENISRVNNIHIDYAVSYKNRVEVIIPYGYTVSGFDKLIQKVDNDYLSFEVKAKVENGKLIIETEKIYKQKDFAKENWSEMCKSLKAAQNFNEAKVMLKKL
ncbi:MAG: DUF3857 domain-containing protein [Flavobacteriales bacterium]